MKNPNKSMDSAVERMRFKSSEVRIGHAKKRTKDISRKIINI